MDWREKNIIGKVSARECLPNVSASIIRMERGLPMFVLGLGCIVVTTVVFGVLCGNMIRARRLGRFEQSQRENEEKQEQYPVYIISSQSDKSIQLPTHMARNKINNTNQSAAILPSTAKFDQSLSRLAIALDPVFQFHPHHLFPSKRIVEL